MLVSVTINGRRRDLDLEPHLTLADVLLGGSACPDGTCGTCTMLVDDEEIRSCLVLGVQCDNRHVRDMVTPGGVCGASTTRGP